MTRNRPAISGYAQIAQEEDDDALEDSDEELNSRHQATSHTYYNPTQSHHQSSLQVPGNKSGVSTNEYQKRSRRNFRHRSNSAVDIKAINARLEKWAEEIAQKFKIRKRDKHGLEERLEIEHSVFQAPDDIRPLTADSLAARFGTEPEGRMTKAQFDETVESVRVAIELGTHPRLITQGSSGSYFACNSDGKVVGVFKPKDEEPYASKNPKWTKWIHRNLFPFFFGRACLIPNLSYVSEAAAFVLDARLQTNLVPYTDVVHLSSISFNYDYWDRRAYYRKKKSLPQKVGSLQVFLKGFKDANIFLKQHPWPDQSNDDIDDGTSVRKKRRRWAEDCRLTRDDVSDDEEEQRTSLSTGSRSRSRSRPRSRMESERRKEFWTPNKRQSFREQLEKLVILDYIMRNTDRGLDNWMIKIDEETEDATIVADIPREYNTSSPQQSESEPYRRESPMSMHGSSSSEETVKVSIGAIDNSLSWPWKHPDAWRSFPFGWLFLPVSLIGQPFSENTRRHFLPLLTSKQWWSETQAALRQCFKQDSDFQEKMYARQIAVMKGQAWNVVETLKTKNHGPLELTRRARVCVWDDLVEVPVVIPLRSPSEEMQRQREAAEQADLLTANELDISTAYSGVNGGPSALPNSKKFTLSPRPSEDQSRRPSADVGRHSFDLANSSRTDRPYAPRANTRVSLDYPRPFWPGPNSKRRNLSFTGHRSSNPTNHDSEGDLGYAAAQDMDRNKKMVIVERIETVKSRNPVFTWC